MNSISQMAQPVISMQAPSDLKSNYYKCFRGRLEVHQFTLGWSVVQIIIGLTFILGATEFEKYRYIFYGAVTVGLSLMLGIGNIKKIWYLYLPEMASKVLAFFFCIMMAIRYVMFSFMIWFADSEYIRLTHLYRYSSSTQEEILNLRIKFILAHFASSIMFVVFAALSFYVFSIVFRDCQFVGVPNTPKHEDLEQGGSGDKKKPEQPENMDLTKVRHANDENYGEI
ncbi:hypothetical protein M3Y97_00944400 [Aphelenchoides bicaudatus]|nr:hypothetical protein M3Y97_00944400 [Aphelenchoides bicaudatus]